MSGIGFFVLGLAAWLGMLLAPPAIAALCWKMAAKRSSRWIMHLIFFPSAIAVTFGLAQVVFFAAHDDGEGPPGLGLALIPPFLVVMITVVSYVLFLAPTGIQVVRDKNVR